MAGQHVKRRAALVPPPGGFTNHIPATIVKGDTRTDAERAQARAAYDLWLRDLQHIRRPKPLLNSTDITELTIVNSSTQGTTARNIPVIDLTNLNDNDNDAQPTPGSATTARSGRDANEIFRGPNGELVAEAQLSFHTRRETLVNQHPSPGMLRFDMARLYRKTGSRAKTTAETEAVTRAQLCGTQASVPKTFEDSLQQNWLKDSAIGIGARLLRGLPMMEDVVFLRAGNYIGITSNCFWKAIAYQVYGDHSFDVRVKAEHLEYFSKVLRWPQHPKHTLYTEMNKTFYSTRVLAQNGNAEDIAANIYQLMAIPCCYTHGNIFEITADLYNLFITVYDLYEFKNIQGQPSTAKVRNITMKGSYNARHVFFLYLAGPEHFQPIVPNDFIASEFRLPRPSNESTYGYPGVGLRHRDRLSTAHVWRVSDTKEGRAGLIDATKGPPPATPHCDKYWIEAVLNGSETDVFGAQQKQA